MFIYAIIISYKSKNKGNLYSNALGQAAWSVLYNDKTVTDTELKLLRVIVDNGIKNDSGLTLYEDVPPNTGILNYNSNAVKDDNYYELLDIVYGE